MPGRCQLTPHPSFSFCVLSFFFNSQFVSLFHHFSQPSVLPSSFLLGFGTWRHHNPLLAGNWVSKDAGSIWVIIKSALRLPNTSSLRHVFAKRGQHFVSQKMGIKEEEYEEEGQNALLIKSWRNHNKSAPAWWENGEHMYEVAGSCGASQRLPRSAGFLPHLAARGTHPWHF